MPHYPGNVTLTLPTWQLAVARAAVRREAKKRERDRDKSEYAPPPGRVDLNAMRLIGLRAVEAALTAALAEHETSPGSSS